MEEPLEATSNRKWLGISENRREAVWWRVSDGLQSTSCLHEGLPLPLLDADGRLLSAACLESLGTSRGVVITATQTSWQICLVTPWCLRKGSTKPGRMFDWKTIKLKDRDWSQNFLFCSFSVNQICLGPPIQAKRSGQNVLSSTMSVDREAESKKKNNNKT